MVQGELLASLDNKKSKELGSKGVAPDGARKTPFLLFSLDNINSKELGSKGVSPEGARRIPSLLHSFDNKNGNCVNLPKTLWHVK